jgi:hypothetical protein
MLVRIVGKMWMTRIHRWVPGYSTSNIDGTEKGAVINSSGWWALVKYGGWIYVGDGIKASLIRDLPRVSYWKN